jgi:YD repeat-containing protein
MCVIGIGLLELCILSQTFTSAQTAPSPTSASAPTIAPSTRREPAVGVNVVLIQIDVASQGQSTGYVQVNDWRYWQATSPRLLTRLQRELGRTCCSTPAVAGPESSLYAVRCSASGLGDELGLAALYTHLDAVCRATGRPSLLVVWAKGERSVLLGLQDNREAGALNAFVMLRTVLAGSLASSSLSPDSLTHCLAPCVLVSGYPSVGNHSTLDPILEDGGLEQLLHSIAVTEVQLAVQLHRTGSIFAGPAGATQQVVVIDIPGIESQGQERPQAWGSILTHSESVARHNLQHQGALGVNLQEPEPGQTTVLSRTFDPQKDGSLLNPVLSDVKAGKSTYIKIDQNIKLGSYLTSGKPEEGAWVRSVANSLIDKVRSESPNALIVVNTHSKGTIDALGLNLDRVDHVILASPRQSVAEVQQVVDAHPNTKFTIITADRDLPHGLEPGFMKLNRPNADVINFKSGSFYPPTVHGQVTNPESKGLFEIRAGNDVRTVRGILGDLVRDSAPPTTIRRMGTNIGPDGPEWNPKPYSPRVKDLLPPPEDKYPLLVPPGGPGGGGGASRLSGLSPLDLYQRMPQSWKTPLPMARPGGVLLAPEVEVVLDQTGLTSGKAEKATSAVAGRPGGEFTYDGKQHLAVKSPGSSMMFKIQAGPFYIHHLDLSVAHGNGQPLELRRFYNSAGDESTALGKGWTLLPLSLQVNPTVRWGKDQKEFGKQVVLRNHGRGDGIAYQIEEAENEDGQTAGTDEFPTYASRASGLVPHLAPVRGGGYMVTFAHGLQAFFNSKGILQSMKSSEKEITYAYQSDRLTEVTCGDSRISIKYDVGGRSIEATGSDGHRVAYDLNEQGYLRKVTGSVSGDYVFGYGTDGRVGKLELVTKEGGQTLIQATYDSQGRMLTRRVPGDRWEYDYDDSLGRLTITDAAGHVTLCYYNGQGQLIAYGPTSKQMTLLNYDTIGRIFQAGTGELLNEPSANERPRFKVAKMLTPATKPSSEEKKE